MALISGDIPGLLGGVSQQPAILRQRNQASGQLNAISDPRRGLGRRPPFEFVRNLGYDSSPLHPFVHWIDRDEVEKYTVLISNGLVRVYDLDGDEYTVEQSADATRYFRAARSNQDLKAMTIADTTFVMNRQVTTAMTTTRAPKTGFFALVWIKGGNYSQKYTLRVAGREYWFKVPDGTALTAPEDWVATSYIAEQLFNLLTGVTPLDPAGGALTAGVHYQVDASGALPAAAWSILRRDGDSVISLQHISRLKFKASISDDDGNSLSSVTTDFVQRFSDLPNLTMNGHTVRVVGDKTTNDDDYWVTFVSDGAVADGPVTGTWQESAEPGALTELDPTTMPYVIRRVAANDGTVFFRVETFDWAKRAVGGDKSNKTPSFVGRKLTDLTLFRNRLGLIADTKFGFSRAGDLADFWRKTVLAVQDDDPIHGEATTQRVLRIDHAVPFNRELLLVSEKAEQVLSSPDALTTKTFSVQETAAYEADQFCRPLTVENTILLPYYDGRYTQVREFRVIDTAGTKGAVSLTDHVPHYLNGRPIQMSTSTGQNLVTMINDDERDILNVYRWANDGADRAISSWSKWDLGGVILGMTWSGSKLWVVVSKVSSYARREDDTFRVVSGDSAVDASMAQIVRTTGNTTKTVLDTTSNRDDVTPAIPGTPGGDDPGDNQDPDEGTGISGVTWNYGYGGEDEPSTDGQVVLVVADFGAGAADAFVPIVAALDYRVADTLCTVTYDAETDITTFVPPYKVGDTIAVVTRYDPDDADWVPGKIYDGTPSVTDLNFTLPGDWTNKALWIGERFSTWYKFSPQIVRKQGPNGSLIPQTTAKLQLLKFKVHYNETGFFTLRVTPKARDTASYTFEGRSLDSGDAPLDSIAFVDGEYSTIIGADGAQVDIELYNDTHLPCWFSAAEWEGQIRSRSQRI